VMTGTAAGAASGARVSDADSVHADDSNANTKSAVTRGRWALLGKKAVGRGCPRSMHDMKR
jgi:hypothetical protein